MSLLDNMRRSITDAAETIAERGQQLSEITKLQVTIKKLQLDRAKGLHELGTRVYALYQGGNPDVTVNLPAEINEICLPLVEIDSQLADTQRQIEEAKLHANKDDAGDVHGDNGMGDANPANAQAAEVQNLARQVNELERELDAVRERLAAARQH